VVTRTRLSATFIPTLPVLFNPLNAESDPICRLLALLGAHHILHINSLRVNTVGPPFYLTPKWPFPFKHSQQNLYAFLVTSVPARSPSNPTALDVTTVIVHFVRLTDYEIPHCTIFPGFLLLELEKL